MIVSHEQDPGAEWDTFVRHQSGWTFCHVSAWHDVIRAVFGHECLYMVARRDDASIAAILPLVRVKSAVLGHYLVSMPFLNYGGPLGDPVAVRAVVDHAVALAARDNVKLLQLRSRQPLPADLAVSHQKITVTLELPENDADSLWQDFDAKVRSQVRRPQKAGAVAAFGHDQIEPFFAVFTRHMRDLGTPAQSLAFFRAIAQAFRDSVWFGCVYVDEQPVAGGCGFRWGSEFEMTWASSLRSFNRISPNMLLYWSFMQRACTEGVRVFNFGRCTPGSGTHRFKRQWGGRDEVLWWYGFSPRTSHDLRTPSPDQGGFALAARIWQRVPLKVANAFGPRIVRFIP
jgi:FemAB-related protein (PEP-CTERM system-associated)